MDLINDEGDFIDAAVKTFEEIFQRFDVDKDGVLNDAELDAFATACNGKPFSKKSKEELRTYFDTDKKKNLTCRGFLEMYLTQTGSDPAETWNDLHKLGYNDNLEKKVILYSNTLRLQVNQKQRKIYCTF